MIVFRSVAAPLRPPRRARRPKPAEPADTEPEPVPLARVTVVAADAFDGVAAAREWLERSCKDEARREQAVDAALRALNRAIHAQRVSAADPYLHDVSRSQARDVRLGFGTGDELVDGRFQEARTLPEPGGRRSRRRLLSPQEEVAGILSGRRALHPSEDLVLRARLDLEQGRSAQAALQASVALQALIAELESGGDSASDALEWARSSEDGARELANTSVSGELDAEQAGALERLVESLERLVRRRRHGGS